MRDNIQCTNCGYSGTVETGAEQCSQCGMFGSLAWKEGEAQEVDEIIK